MVFKKTIFAYLILGLIIATGLAACGEKETEIADHLTPIEVKQGDHFAVVLKENHKAGESWKFEQRNTNSIAKYKGSSWHGESIGAKFHFVATQTGTCLLNFSLIEYNKLRDSCHFVLKINH